MFHIQYVDYGIYYHSGFHYLHPPMHRPKGHVNDSQQHMSGSRNSAQERWGVEFEGTHQDLNKAALKAAEWASRPVTGVQPTLLVWLGAPNRLEQPAAWKQEG